MFTELHAALAAEDAKPSAELVKLEQEIDNTDPSKLHIGVAAELLVESNRKVGLVFHVTEVRTNGRGHGSPTGHGSFYGDPVPTKFLPQNPIGQAYILVIRAGEAILTLRKDDRTVFHGRYKGAQHGLDGAWHGWWSQ